MPNDSAGKGGTARPANPKPEITVKPVEWNTSAKRALLEMPYEARLSLSQSLKAVQYGEVPDDVSPFEGHAGCNVMKISENYDSDTYRHSKWLSMMERLTDSPIPMPPSFVV